MKKCPIMVAADSIIIALAALQPGTDMTEALVKKKMNTSGGCIGSECEWWAMQPTGDDPDGGHCNIARIS